MSKKKKLSSVQIMIIEELVKSPYRFIWESPHLNCQRIMASDTGTDVVKYFRLDTLNVLKNTGIVVEFEPKKFRLNQDRDFSMFRK